MKLRAKHLKHYKHKGGEISSRFVKGRIIRITRKHDETGRVLKNVVVWYKDKQDRKGKVIFSPLKSLKFFP